MTVRNPIIYNKLTQIFTEVLYSHAPLKHKTIRGNQAPFMTRELSKAIMDKSKAKNKVKCKVAF